MAIELYTIPVGEQVILFRPLAGLAFVGNQAMASLVTRWAQQGWPADPGQHTQALAFLEQIGFCEPDPPAPGLAPPDPSGADFQPGMAILLLTNRCQLRCTYCYAAGGEGLQRDLPFEYGQAAIDYVSQVALQSGKSRFELIFHGGGEPTTAWKVLQDCVAYARQKPLPAWIALTSNGIWSRSQVEWIVDHLDQVGISMDGSPTTQDRQRPFASGRGSADWVMRTLAALDRRSFRYGIRMTATAPWERLPEDVRFLCQATGCRSIQVEPAFNQQRGEHRQGDAQETRRFAQAFLEAYDLAAAAGRRLYCSSARLGLVTPTFCLAPYQGLIVNAEGSLVTCYEVSDSAHPLSDLSTIGRIEAGQAQVDFARRARLHALLAERRSGCRDCFCYWSCAGDCYPRAYGDSPEQGLVYGARCEMNRELTAQLLLRAIAVQGGVWRSAWRTTPASAIPFEDSGLG